MGLVANSGVWFARSGCLCTSLQHDSQYGTALNLHLNSCKSYSSESPASWLQDSLEFDSKLVEYSSKLLQNLLTTDLVEVALGALVEGFPVADVAGTPHSTAQSPQLQLRAR